MLTVLPLYVGDIIRFLFITVSVSKKSVTFHDMVTVLALYVGDTVIRISYHNC